MRHLTLTVLVTSALAVPALAQDTPEQPAPEPGSRAAYERAASLGGRMRGKVVGARLQPVWSANGRFVVVPRTTGGGARRWITVDTQDGTPRPAFDHAAVAAHIAPSAQPDRLPIQRVAIADDGALELLVGRSDVRVLRVAGDEVSDVLPSEARSFSLAPRAPQRAPKSRSGGGESAIVFVNATDGMVKLAWIDMAGERKEYGQVTPGATHRQHTFARHAWVAIDEDGKELAAFVAGAQPAIARITGPVEPETRAPRTGPKRPWRLQMKNGNVRLVATSGKRTVELTTDGSPEDPYTGPVHWSPGGDHVLLFRTRPAQKHPVHLIESSPKDTLQPRLHTFDYLKPGDRIRAPRPRLFDVRRQKAVELDESYYKNAWSVSRVHWAADASRVFVHVNTRGHQTVRVLSIDARTGKTQMVVEERSETFVDYSQKTVLHHVEATDELIWASERDGWNHLYLIDRATGDIVRQLTRGPYVVRALDRVDSDARRAWVRVMGLDPDQDPYHVQHGVVDLDTGDFTLLTPGDGTHEIAWSPDRAHFTDTYSRVDLPPVHELRRADGTLVCELGRADHAALVAAGWQAPERFAAKGRDGATDIWGVIYRPTHFDPERRYPVIEAIYAGPHGHHVPKTFAAHRGQQALAELGFVVVQIDGMGTNWRSKAFHDVAWKNIKDAGFPDRIAWMRAAAADRPWMDLERVGIFGGSAGGQNAMRAVLDHHDFYRAAVADCGCHDNRMDKIWWNEAWMGWPVDESYAASSNAVDAHKLGGKLLLTVGELDRNVDPASTMQVVDALIRADKDFDLIVFPGQGHGAGGSAYGTRRRNDFFVRHLLGVEPRFD